MQAAGHRFDSGCLHHPDRIGVTRTTAWRWRKADPAFDEAVRAAIEDRGERRLDHWADTAFGRIVAGRASPAVELYYITNLARQVAERKGEAPRWVHVGPYATVEHKHAVKITLEQAREMARLGDFEQLPPAVEDETTD